MNKDRGKIEICMTTETLTKVRCLFFISLKKVIIYKPTPDKSIK